MSLAQADKVITKQREENCRMSAKKAFAVAGTCVFCATSEKDEDIYGKLMTKFGITAHYFCMLFSSGLSQNGKSETQGLLGFLPQDIMKEVKRAGRLKCVYCKHSGATIGCVVRNCKKTFHLGCGRKNSTLHLFYDTFCSYCPIHRLQQDVEPSMDPDLHCPICINPVVGSPSSVTLRSPCCRSNWFHRDCLQSYATSAGLHFFKCPTCNNKESFQQEMLTFGIYIPDRDASWETEPNAYQELLERYNNCDAGSCLCAEGRKYDQEGSKWEIIICDTCGSQGSHVACHHLVKKGKEYICPECKDIDDKAKKKTALLSSPPSKRRSQELMKLEAACSSSKQGSQYPGPSTSPKKKGLPTKRLSHSPLTPPTRSFGTQLSGTPNSKFRKRRKKHSMPHVARDAQSEEKSHCLVAGDKENCSRSTPKLFSPPTLSKRRYEKHKRTSLEPDDKQQTLMSWLNRGQVKSPIPASSTASFQSDLAPSTSGTVAGRSTPKKKPFVMVWKGKEFLIKSPRVLLTKNTRSRAAARPKHLEIDMNAWKEGSVESLEVDLLTSIDHRVTRNMVSSDNVTPTFYAKDARKCSRLHHEKRKLSLVKGSSKCTPTQEDSSRSENDLKKQKTNKIITLPLASDEKIKTKRLFDNDEKNGDRKQHSLVKDIETENEVKLGVNSSESKIASLVEAKDLQTAAELTPQKSKKITYKVKGSSSLPRLHRVKPLPTDRKDDHKLSASLPKLKRVKPLPMDRKKDLENSLPRLTRARPLLATDCKDSQEGNSSYLYSMEECLEKAVKRRRKRRHTIALEFKNTPEKSVDHLSSALLTKTDDATSFTSMLSPSRKSESKYSPETKLVTPKDSLKCVKQQENCIREEYLESDSTLSNDFNARLLRSGKKERTSSLTSSPMSKQTLLSPSSPKKELQKSTVSLHNLESNGSTEASLHSKEPSKSFVSSLCIKEKSTLPSLHDLESNESNVPSLHNKEENAMAVSLLRNKGANESDTSSPLKTESNRAGKSSVSSPRNVERLSRSSLQKADKVTDMNDQNVKNNLFAKDKELPGSPGPKKRKCESGPLVLWSCEGTRQVDGDSRITRAMASSPDKTHRQQGTENCCPNIPNSDIGNQQDFQTGDGQRIEGDVNTESRHIKSPVKNGLRHTDIIEKTKRTSLEEWLIRSPRLRSHATDKDLMLEYYGENDKNSPKSQVSPSPSSSGSTPVSDNDLVEIELYGS